MLTVLPNGLGLLLLVVKPGFPLCTYSSMSVMLTGSRRSHPQSKRLTSVPPSQSHDSWAHIQRQLDTVLGSSQNGFNGTDTSEQKDLNRLCIASCSIIPWDHAQYCAVHRTETLKALLMEIDNSDQTASYQTKPRLIHCRQWSLRQWNRSENLQVQALLSRWSQWSRNVI